MMRIIVDLQSWQTGARHASACLELVQALLRVAKDHEIVVLLNEVFPESARRVRSILERSTAPSRIAAFGGFRNVRANQEENAWRADAAELAREHFIESLAPDIVLVTNLFAGYDDDAVVSVGRLNSGAHTAVLMWDTLSSVGDSLKRGRKAYRAYWARKLQSLKNAGLIVALDEAGAAEAMETLCVDERRIVSAGLDSAELCQLRKAYCRRTFNGGAAKLEDALGRPEPAKAPTFDSFAETLLREVMAHRARADDKGAEPRAPVGPELPKLAYLSPLPPARSGIADYSAELIPELARYYDIELITDQSEVSDFWLTENFPVRSIAWFEANARRFDRIVYQLGNHPLHAPTWSLLKRFPGTVVLHDFFLGDMLQAEQDQLRAAVHASHGSTVWLDLHSRELEDVIRDYPASGEAFQESTGVILHSRMAADLAENWYGQKVAEKCRVVPHLRAQRRRVDRADARRRLGVGPADFLVCSFGSVQPNKRDGMVFEAWRQTELAIDSGSALAFVGAVADADYVFTVRRRIRETNSSQQVWITDYVTRSEYQLWLAAADTAVQLRANSRGETSGPVLDCLAGGVPLVVNAHGTAAQLPDGAVIKVPDRVSTSGLTAALDSLGVDQTLRRRLSAAGKVHVGEHHAPEKVGLAYHNAIEAFAGRSIRRRENKLVERVAESGALADAGQKDMAGLSEAIASACASQTRRLLIDVSVLARRDVGTGIQRVVRAQAKQLLEAPPEGHHAVLVYMTREGGRWHFRRAGKFTVQLFMQVDSKLEEPTLEANAGDILYVPDLFFEGVIGAAAEGLFNRWRARGVSIYFLVHDLLPIDCPRWFPRGDDSRHRSWAQVLARDATGVIGVSASVAHRFRRWFEQSGCVRPDPLQVGWAHLGADLERSAPSVGLPENASDTVESLAQRPTFLMVGTVEPRKGHLQVLGAMDLLWKRGLEAQLVIVGAEGWIGLPASERRTIPEITERLRRHVERNKRLFWLRQISDEYLEQVYRAACCLLAASEGEGFGLPLIEAARRGLPVMARDIPVFREVAGAHATYFSAEDGESLASSLEAWLAQYHSGQHIPSNGVQWRSWAENVDRLKHLFAGKGWMLTLLPRPNENSGPEAEVV